MRKTLFLIISLLFVVVFAEAQMAKSDFLKFENQLDASSNPAFDLDDQYDENNFSIRLANLNFGIGSSGPQYNNILTNVGGGTFTLNANDLLDEVNDNNVVRSALGVETIHAAGKFGDVVISLGHAFRFNGVVNNSYNEYALGLSYGLDKLRVGIRAKYLTGIQDVSTSFSRIRLLTRDDIYQLDFNNDFVVNTSNFLDYNSLEDITFDFNGPSFLFNSNTGFALDLGLEYQLTETMTASISIIDLGSISWNEGVSNFRSIGSYSYEGVNIRDYLFNDQEINISDTLSDLLNIDETNTAYKTSLPTHFQFSLLNQISDNTFLRFTAKLTSFQDNSHFSIEVD